MAVVKVLKWPPDDQLFTVPTYTNIAAGDWIEYDRTIIDSAQDVPLCVVVESPSAQTPQRTFLGVGNGALLDMGTNITAANPGTSFYSDGDGTISSTQPSGAAGTIIYKVGTIEPDENGGTSTRLRIDIQEYEKGA